MELDGITIGPFRVPHPASVFGPDEPDDGFGRPADAYLPQPLQVIENALEGAARRAADLVVREERPTPDGASITRPLDRSREAQRALVDHHAQFGTPDRFHANDNFKVWRTEVWPLGQVLHGRILEAMSTGDWGSVEGTFRDLEAYRSGDGYTGGIAFPTQRYYDDNEWIGLAALQAYGATKDARYLSVAQHTFRFVAEGESPDGGVFWYEQDKAGRHTCSTAPAGQFALRLYEATGRTDPELLAFAERQAQWLADNLRTSDGLYADNVSNSGKVDPTVYSYNQGTPLGLDVQLYRATGDEKYLTRAKETAQAAMDHYTPDKLWTQPPVFNTIMLRNIMALHSVAPEPAYVTFVDEYLERLWTQGRSSDTGLFDQNGIGHYSEPGAVIDQGAVAQLFAARALPPDRWKDIT